MIASCREPLLGRILVSQDDDLLREGMRLLRQHEDFSGIIYSHQLRITIGQMVEDLELIAKATSAAEWRGRIEYLPISYREPVYAVPLASIPSFRIFAWSVVRFM